MPATHSPTDWSDLLELMADRFGTLTDQALENLRTLLESGRNVVNSSECGLLVPTDNGTELRFLVSVNSRPGISQILTDIRVPCERSIAGCVFNTGQLIAVANPEDFYPGVDKKTGLTTVLYLATPVMSDDGVLGVLTFVNRPANQPQEPFNEVEIEWSTRLADLAAAGLKYYRRLSVQQKLFQTELSQAAERFAATDGVAFAPFEGTGVVEDDSSPLARALLALERMSPREQELAAELIGVLSAHGD
jgi:hypothetical protein